MSQADDDRAELLGTMITLLVTDATMAGTIRAFQARHMLHREALVPDDAKLLQELVEAEITDLAEAILATLTKVKHIRQMKMTSLEKVIARHGAEAGERIASRYTAAKGLSS